MNHPPFLVLAACGALAIFPAAASEADIKALRDELAQLRHAYEQRLNALERRLADAESVSKDAQARAETLASRSSRQGEGTASAFNPEIGLVLQGRVRKMRDVAERSISGYWPAGDDHEGGQRGISLEHTELMFAANIDPAFRGAARFAIAPGGEVEVEEASVSTLGLGGGFALRGGRFASAIGYQNGQHPHEWDFADASLMQEALFGVEGYRHDGLQVRWVAPSDYLLMFGAEIGRGAAFPGTDRNRNGANAGSLFAKIGGDAGASSSWQAGLSFHRTQASDRETHFEDTDVAGPNEVQGRFSGRSRTAMADFVWKWAPNGNARERNLKIQTEIFRRDEDGSLACLSDVATSPCNGGAALGRLGVRQTGGYAQTVYQFRPQWRVGFRHDWLSSGSKSFDPAAVFGALSSGHAYFSGHKPRRDTIMVDWSNSEFSRLRVQYARDRAVPGLTDRQWTLQYVMSLGAHVAHRY